MQTVVRVLVVALAGVFYACGNQTVVETPSGLAVEMLRDSEGNKFEVGDVVEVNLAYSTKDGKTLFDTGERGGPAKIRMTDQDRGLFHEMIQTLSVGDSATCEIPVEDLYEITFGRPVPDSITRGTLLKFNIGVITANNFSELLRLQKEKDITIIDAYLDENNIEATKDETGLRYVLNKNGEGEKPNIGDSVTVHYTGKFLSSGQVFDSSKKSGKPFEFVIGRGVIEGWSKGFALLNEGAEGTLYIPSTMAYGENGHPAGIPPNAILIFDVEFLDIKGK